jgi:heme-degrading monooxygenase HmoA
MIQHSVIFKLKHDKGTDEERSFLQAARQLQSIPGVQDFECLRQISTKNPFDYGLAMKFVDQQTYDTYSNHPDHTRFIEEFWLKDVADFLEIDYTILPK